MELKAHGASCCGINHLYCFGSYPCTGSIRELDDDIKEFKNGGAGYRGLVFGATCQREGAIEVTLTDQQVSTVGPRTNTTWAQELHARGFQHTARFYNNNSGNYVNIFILVVNNANRTKEQPFAWPPTEPLEPVVPVVKPKRVYKPRVKKTV